MKTRRAYPERVEVFQPQRLQKILAASGIGSRRQVEGWIRRGQILVNGYPAVLGQLIDPGKDQVKLGGRPLKLRSDAPAARVLVYNKPEGEICTKRDEQGRRSVFASLPRAREGRWVAVGRLDINTTGLLLFTNSGTLANALMHPRAGIEREYIVRVRGQVEDNVLSTLLQGVALDDGPGAFKSIRRLPNQSRNHQWFSVVLSEGRNREVRRLWESQGLQVSRLKRVRFGPVVLPRRLTRGNWQELDRQGLRALLESSACLPVNPS